MEIVAAIIVLFLLFARFEIVDAIKHVSDNRLKRVAEVTKQKELDLETAKTQAERHNRTSSEK